MFQFIMVSMLLTLSSSALLANGANKIRFDRVPIQGSTQYYITDIAQDETGFIWIGTRSGLFRYDGYSTNAYKHDPTDPRSISSSHIQHIRSTPGNIVWIATDTGTIDRLNTVDNSISHYSFEADGRSITTTVQIFDLTTDSHGKLWVSTSLGGLHYYESRSDSFLKYSFTNSDQIDIYSRTVTQIIDYGQDSLLLSVERAGPVVLNTIDGIALPLGDGSYNISNWGDAAFYEDGQNNLWVGTWSNGLLFFNFRDGSYSRIPELSPERFGPGINFITDVIQDDEGNLWIVPLAAGVIKFHPQDRSTAELKHVPNDPQSLNSNEVTAIFKDRTGAIWIGTSNGLNNYSQYRYKFSRSAIDPSRENGDHNYILSLFEDSNGDLWTGTLSGGLYKLDTTTGRFQQFPLYQHPGQGESAIFTIYEDSRNDFYLGTGDAGLLRLDRNSGTVQRLTEPLQITSIIEDKDGSLWIGTYVNGIGEYDRDNNSFEYWSPNPADSQSNTPFDVTTIYEDSHEFLWIGSNGLGLIRFDKKQKTYIHFQHEHGNVLSLSDNRILSILEDTEGSIWIGTRSGLNKLNPQSNEIRRFYEGEILPDNQICSILEDEENNLWFSTLNGIARYDPKTNSSIHFSVADGLQGNWFSPGAGFKNSRGQMYWGGVNGYNTYLPGEHPINPHEPVIAITAFRVFDEIIPLNISSDGNQRIELQSDQNFFSFEFSALDYVNPVKNRYSFRLENLESEWNDNSSRRFARYTKVPPGNYTFVVRGSNNDGIWNQKGLSVKVTVHPPFWMTWQFRGLLVVAIGGLVYGGFKVRMRMIQRQKDLLELEVAERRVAQAKLETNQSHLRALAARLTFAEELERKRISRALHDDVGHALLTSKVKIIAHMDDEANQEAVKSLQAVIDSLNDTIKIVRSLTVEISPPALHKFGLESAAERLLEKFGEDNNIRTRFSKDGTCPLDDRLAILLYQSLRELFVNILKHAEAETIQLSFNNDGEQIFVRLQDDGNGFDVDQTMESEEELKGYGLFSIQERLESIGGQLKISSKPGSGTTITMIGPLSENDGRAKQ